MATEFRLLFEGKPDLEIDRFQQSLPREFFVYKKDDRIYVTIESAFAEDQKCQYLIDRELDRHFFLTSVRIKAEMVKRNVISSITVKNRIHGSLLSDIQPQNWNSRLPIQLRLWSIAADTTEIQTKLILLFQIIELANSTATPESTDPTKAPNSLTECKFIRNLVAHSGEVHSEQLKKYCKDIGWAETMMDVTNPNHYKFMTSKVSLMEDQAKNVIAEELQLGLMRDVI